MAVDLETVKKEIQAYLEEAGLPVFYGYSRIADSLPVRWDTDRRPDFREFLAIARSVEAKLFVLFSAEFSAEEVDDAFDQLEQCDLPREESLGFEDRLRKLQVYEGFTRTIELSFDMDGRVYLYRLDADWYQELLDIREELEAAAESEDEEDDEAPLGGYFSNN